MIDRKRYQETFSRLQVSPETRRRILDMEMKQSRRRPRLAVLALAAVLIVVLAATAMAAFGGTLGDWFAREWANRTGGEISEDQALVIDSLTEKVGESRTVGDVTVTVDSITVGGDVLWALVDVEGLDFAADQQYTFGKMAVDILPDPSEGNGAVMAYSVGSIGLTESGAVRMLLEYSGTFSTANQLNAGGYTLSLRLEDLARVVPGGGSADDEVIAQGQWDFSIPLTVESMSTVITIDSAVVKGRVSDDAVGSAGETEGDGALEGTIIDTSLADFTLKDIQITSTGVSFVADEATDLLQVTAIFADGTEVEAAGGGGSRMEDGAWYSNSQWPVPLNVEDIAALRIGETEIAVT